MSSNKSWQQALDNFLAKKPLSPDNRVLARTLADSDSNDLADIEVALHIEQYIDELGLVPLPQALHNKLQAITTNNQENKDVISDPLHSSKPLSKVIKANFNTKPYRLMAMAAGIAMVSILSVNWLSSPLDEQPTLAEINQAQQELAIAFRYLSIAKNKSSAQVLQTINLQIQRPITKSLFKPLNHFKES